jgi:hypothetical protein
MQRLAITRELVWKIKQMYEEKDELGRRKWSQQRLGQYFRVSETTVFRAIHDYGAYGINPLPEVKSSEQVDADAAASLERFKQLNPDLLPKQESATERMTREAAELRARAQAGDKLVDELTGDQNDGRNKATSN